MIQDRNKTELTKQVTAAAYRYLDERGSKPLETEVPICDGWIADIAGVLNPTITEMIELKLLKRRPRSTQQGYEWWEDAKAVQRLMTVLVEVKTSRADFRGDKKWALPLPVNLAYLAIPKGLPVSMEEMPQRWGILEYSETTDIIRCVRVPSICEVTIEQQLSVILDVAVRRDHHTRYERAREFRREQIVERNKNQNSHRIHACIRAVAAIATGTSWGGKLPHASVEEALEHHGIKNLYPSDIEVLQRLWRTAVHP